MADGKNDRILVLDASDRSCIKGVDIKNIVSFKPPFNWLPPGFV